MSISEVQRFAQDCAKDPSLAKIVSDSGTDIGAVVTAANAKNYNFTVDEAVQALAQTKFNELHASQLAGGKIITSTNIVVDAEAVVQTAALALVAAAAVTLVVAT